MKKIFTITVLLFILLGFTSENVSAQIPPPCSSYDFCVTEMAPTTDLSACTNYNFTYLLTNNSGTDITSPTSFTINLPRGIVYSSFVSSSGGYSSGNSTVTNSYGGVSPIFTVNNWSNGFTITLIITVQTPCSDAHLPAITTVNIGSYTVQTTNSTVDVVTPTLNVINALGSSPINMNTGMVSEYVFEVKNASSNTADINEITINCTADPNVSLLGNYYISYSSALPSGTNKYTYSVPSVSPSPNYVSSPNNITSNTITVGASDFQAIYGSSINTTLQPGQSFFVHIPYQVMGCSLSGDGGDFKFSWGCNSSECSSTDMATNINVVSGNPSMTATTLSTFDNATFCASVGKSSSQIGFIYTNTGTPESGFPSGSAMATKLQLYIYGDITFGSLDVSTFKISFGSTVFTIPSSIITVTTTYSATNFLYKIDFTQLTTALAGSWDPLGTGNTLADLDGDGSVDNIAEGGTFTITATYNYNTSTCPDFATCGSNLYANLPAIQSKYNNECYSINDVRQQAFSVTNISDAAYYYSTTGGTATMTAPADVIEASPFTVTLSPNTYYERWGPKDFDFDCPNGQHQMVVQLASGYHLDPTGLTSTGTGLTSTTSYIYNLPTITATARCNPALHQPITPTIQENYTTKQLIISFGRIDNYSCGPYKETYDLPPFTVPLILNCDGTVDPAGSADVLSYSLQYVCDPSCASCASVITCASTSTYHHCLGACTSFFSTAQNTFSFQRPGSSIPGSLGYNNPDNTTEYYDCSSSHQPQPVTTQTDPPLNFSTAYPGDEIEVKAKGTFQGSGTNPGSSYTSMGLQIQYNQLPAGTCYSDDLFDLDLTRGSILITDGTTLITTTVPATSISITYTTISGVVYMYLKLPSTITSGLNATDIYTFQTDLYLIAKSTPALSLTTTTFYSPGAHNLINLRAQYTGFETPELGGTQDLSCDSWGAPFTMLQPDNSVGYYPGYYGSYYQATSYCGNYQANFFLKSKGAYFGQQDDFPDEMRPYVKLNPSVTIKLPPYYEYTAGTSQLTILKATYSSTPGANGFSGNEAFYTIPTNISGETVAGTLASGYTITYNGLDGSGNCWPLLDQINGSFAAVEYITVPMNPTCEAPASSNFEFKGSYTEQNQQPDVTYQVTTPFDLTSLPVNHQNPTLQLDLPSSVSDLTNTVTFNFSLCNTGTSVVNDGWLAIQNNSLTNSIDLSTATVYLMPGHTPLSSTSTTIGGQPALLVEAGVINPSECLNLELDANVATTACLPVGSDPVSDFLNISYGNECTGGVLTSTDPLSLCQQGIKTFPFTRYPSNLELDVPGGFSLNPVDLCNGTLVYNFIINSSDIGTIANPKFLVNLPTGISLNNIQFTYPCSGTPTSPITVDGSGNTTGNLVWSLNNYIPAIMTSGLPGTISSPNNQVCITLTLTTSCGYNANDYISFSASGISTCSETISTLPQQNRPFINGASPADNLTLTESIANDISCSNKTGLVTISVNNTGSATVHDNTVTISIPTGTSVDVSTITNAYGSFSPPIGGIITWTLPHTMPPGLQTLTFNLGLTTTPSCPGNVTLSSTIGYNESVSCTSSGGSCDVSYNSAPVSINFNACCQCNTTLSTSSTNVHCYGGNDGTASVTATGGTLPYTYTWSNGATTSTATNLVAGSYTVTVTDAHNCIATATVVINNTPPPVITISPSSATICSGTNNTLTAAGGSSYVWSTGATTTAITINPSSTTSYTVTGTDVNGCTNSAVATVTVNPLPTVAVNSTAICNGASATLTATGAISYAWNTGATTSTITVNPSTTTSYTVTGTDVNGCANAAVATVTVNPLPTVAVNSTAICNGASATLTATGATSYVWSTGATTTSITVNPTSTTSYTVTGTGVNGCTNSSVATVTVNPLPTVAVNSTAICNGANTTLTAAGAASYSWSTGATTTAITVSPSSTTSYTVTGTDMNGCTNSVVATVTVNPLPTVTVNSLTICYKTRATLTAAGATSYSWSTGATTTSITVSPTSTTSYTVTGTDVNGCTNSAVATVTVDPNCCIDPRGKNYGSYNSVPFSSSIGSQFPTIGPATATISGTLTIDNNFTITGYNVAMGPGAIIDILPNNTLIIDASSRLYACNDMWQGIIVEPGAHLVINKNSIVEDAKIAIEGQSSTSAAGSIKVNNSTLNNNYQDIVIDPYSNATAYPLTLENSTLTCQIDGSYSSNAYLKAPYATQLTYTGVFLKSVEYPGTSTNPIAAPIITIGSTVPSNTNDFSNMHYGVYAIQSNFAVYNNKFHDLTGFPYICAFPLVCPVWGVAVYATTTIDYTTPDYNTYNTAIVGGMDIPGTSTLSNTMKKCYGAVWTENYVYAKILNNDISNSTDNVAPGVPPVGNFGIKVQEQPGYYSTIINNNSIVNTRIGINVLRDLTFNFYGSSPIPASAVGTYIDSNNISAATTGNNIMNDGIYVQDASIPKPIDNFVNASFNTIENAYTCINMLNVKTTNAYINSNPTLHITPSTMNSLTQKAGIRVQGGYFINGYIDNNPDISAPGTYIGTNATNPARADTTVRGIFLTSIPFVQVGCNVMSSLGQDMVFEANCTTAKGIYSNTMEKAYDQFVLLSNGIIGPQGNSGTPINDTWGTGTLGAAVRSQTYTYNTHTPGLYSPLWVASGTAFTPTNNQTNPPNIPAVDSYNEPGALNLASGPSPLNCGSIIPVLSTFSLSDQIATDSVHYAVMVPQTQYINKAMLFQQLAQNDSSMLGDTILQHFYTHTQSSNIGTLYAVDTLSATGNIAAASALNSAITPINTIEQNHQDVNAVYMSTLAIGHDTLNTAQYNTLNAVAVQCPLMGGMAVYKARVMLNWMLDTVIEYTDNCGSAPLETMHRPTKTQASNLNASVYPNPASTLLNVAVNMSQIKSGSICLYNTTGEKVRCETLTGNITSISITDLPSGMYYYRITDANGNLVKADKVTIVK